MSDSPSELPSSTDIPGPTDQHHLLMQKLGTWKVEALYFLDPKGEPIKATGTDTVTSLGSFWTIGNFEAEVMGAQIKGIAITGYDVQKEQFVGTWQDSSTPFMYQFAGDIEEDGTLVMRGENVDPMSKQTAMYRSVETLGKDERKLELFIEIEPGTDFKILEYAYTRI